MIKQVWRWVMAFHNLAVGTGALQRPAGPGRYRRQPSRFLRLEELSPRTMLAADVGGMVPTSTVPTPNLVDSQFDGELLVAHNSVAPADVDADQLVSSTDGLLLVNAINRILAEPAAVPDSALFLDVSADGRLSADDFTDFTFLANMAPTNASAPGANAAPEGGLLCGPCIGSPDPQDEDPDDSVSGGSDTADEDTTHSGGDEDVAGGDSGDSPSSGDPNASQGDGDAPDTQPGDGQDWVGAGDGSSGSGDSDSNPDSGSSGSSGSGSGGSGSQGTAGPDDDTYASHCEATLTGATVDEGEDFTLNLVVDPVCVTRVTVDWGDGVTQSYGTAQQPTYIYHDDDPSNTPSDDYTVRVTLDTVDGSSQELQTVVTVNNVPPRAADDSYSTDEDTSIRISDAVLNDHDPSFLDLVTMTISSVDTTGTIGTVTKHGDGVLEYDPRGKFDCLAVGETATDSFRYTIHDDDDATRQSTATVTMTIHGRRELYTLSYGAGPHASEQAEVPATAFFTLSPPAKCGSLTVGYRRTDYVGPAAIPMANDQDVKNPQGFVAFQQGASQASTLITPNDDTLIEANEWFYFTVDEGRTADYELQTLNKQASFRIADDEWRFVAETKNMAEQIGPINVEAFSRFGISSLLTGAYSLNSVFRDNLNTSSDSEAWARANIAGALSRPGMASHQTDDYLFTSTATRKRVTFGAGRSSTMANEMIRR